jgi:hypothetical protein
VASVIGGDGDTSVLGEFSAEWTIVDTVAVESSRSLREFF